MRVVAGVGCMFVGVDDVVVGVVDGVAVVAVVAAAAVVGGVIVVVGVGGVVGVVVVVVFVSQSDSASLRQQQRAPSAIKPRGVSHKNATWVCPRATRGLS
eukprot:4608074-Pyramimonas_sp.AAC.1